jgi:hypothetical protein
MVDLSLKVFFFVSAGVDFIVTKNKYQVIFQNVTKHTDIS